ncbi:MAG TPA: hypothetical protein VNS58_13375 [Puia sp.]|nr:hypothetical protein [Puia sp.]
MKQFYVMLALAFVCPLLSPAQYLADNSSTHNLLFKGEVPAAKSPQWEKEQDQINGHISNTRLSKMRSVTDAIVTFFHDSCLSDIQAAPLWHGEYFSEKTSAAPQIKFGVFCNFYEQKARLTVTANDISMLLDHLVINNQDFLTIKIANAVKNDCPYFEYDNNRVWLVTTGNTQLPYTPVTRKEYLQQASQELTAIKNSIAADWKQKTTVRPAAVQEAEKKATLDQLSSMYSGMDLQVREKMFLRDYKTDEEYLKENTDKGTADLDSTLSVMDHLLQHMRSEELNKPAIVTVAAANFQGFEDGLSDKMLIRMDPTYFDPSLSGEKAQLFVVCWHHDPSDATAAGIDRQIRERLDGQKLRALLGK